MTFKQVRIVFDDGKYILKSTSFLLNDTYYWNTSSLLDDACHLLSTLAWISLVLEMAPGPSSYS